MTDLGKDAHPGDDVLPPNGRLVVPVMRPLLPDAETLLPYLRRIDSTRIYSNFGPLALEFENRLALHFGLESGAVVSASTGTAGLIGAILATAGRATPRRPLALMPSFTFVATAVAAQSCGFEPYLADVDASTWMLDPDRMAELAELDQVGVLVVVAPFGRPVPQGPWKDFQDRTGIPVVIDGAACFESASNDPGATIGSIPLVLSFHATKSLATGEGGCVATTNRDIAAAVGRSLNFGFHSSRDSMSASINGKLSEYHAAIGHAELDGWSIKEAAFRRAVRLYRDRIGDRALSAGLITAPDICSSYVLFECASREESISVQQSLRAHDVESRQWYGRGLHGQTYFANCRREPLPGTDELAPRLIGLPMATDLDEASVSRVVAALIAGATGNR